MSATSPLTLASSQKSKKPKMLVVDDEPDNLDLLYRTFRRDFQVLRAESGIEALNLLSNEGEVAVIIADQRMPEMKGTEFLSKTVPDFPDTVRIILTGFTDVEDLVEAINAGQVYRYITKPWNPDELRGVVDRAAETYELLKQQNEALYRAEKQTKLVVTVGQIAAQETTLADALSMLAKGFGQIVGAKVCTLQLIDQPLAGTFGPVPNAAELVQQTALAQRALASQSIQASAKIAADPELAADPLYSASETQSHLVFPVLYQGQPLALMSLQWESDYSTLDDVSQIMNVLSPSVALALVALSQ
ncbi:response regulator [Romeria aff. gracilis LEGE 07310]|uniref:Response regulator n=1 Tax=Vasconcelosia minhoensis LEGE 07310 TaxID=915328 RepID=A0A8J7DD36_9CYAN|nr:response regulator [Romeria gracilis]MBE9079507.1 response regulator [Romeria aff. gracilis LEGE 07310]